MIKKTTILLIYMILCISCSITSNIEFTKIQTEQLTIIPIKQTLITNTAVPNRYWLYLSTTFKNDSSSRIIIDFDDLYLIDDSNEKLRVEYVSGVKINSDDKLYLDLKPKSRIEKKITFLIKEGNQTEYILFKDKKVKLNFVNE
jgi:hypothetical protein|tara:strand:+ start:2026 stop:2457 length:432 start_codon:yes stop_codon:yes gene_type:complete